MMKNLDVYDLHYIDQLVDQKKQLVHELGVANRRIVEQEELINDLSEQLAVQKEKYANLLERHLEMMERAVATDEKQI